MNEKDLVKLFQRRISMFEVHYDKEHKRMRENYQIYKTGAKSEGLLSEAREGYYDVNFIYSLIKGLIPALVINDPDILVRPRRPEGLGKTATISAILNYYWPELRIKKEVERCILDALLYGMGVMKMGWNFKLNTSSKANKQEGDIGGQKDFNVNDFIKADDPSVLRISPLNFRWDPQASCLENARWVSEKIVRPLEAVRRDEKYDKKAREEVGPSGLGMQDVIFGDEGTKVINNDPDQYVILEEVYDKERELLITMAKNLDKPLRIIKYPFPGLEGTHYEVLNLDPLPDTVLGYPRVSRVESSQRTIRRIRTLEADHIEKNVPKYVYNTSGEVDPKKIKEWADAPASSAIGVPGDPKQFVDVTPVAQIPQDHYRVADIAEGDILKTLGVPPSRFGSSAGARTTASEINTINNAEQFRIEDDRRKVEDFSSNISRKIIQIMANKISDDKVLMIAGAEKFNPMKFSKKDIQGEYDFTIKTGSMAKPNRETDRQQLMNMANLLGAIPGANILPVVREFIKTFPDMVLDMEEIFPSGSGLPTPAEAGGGEGAAVSADQAKQQEAPDLVSLLANNNQPNNSRGR